MLHRNKTIIFPLLIYPIVSYTLKAMTDEPDNLQLPPKPEWVITTALKNAVALALIGAAIGAIATKIPFIRTRISLKNTAEQAISSGAQYGIIGGIFGYVDGAKEWAKYPLQVKNTELKQKISELKSNKSFAESITQEKLENSEQLIRS